MVTYFSAIAGCRIATKDGALGRVVDVLFDDRTWQVRYAVVALSPWLALSKVVLAPATFSVNATTEPGLLKVDLTTEQARQAAPLASALPVSAQRPGLRRAYDTWLPAWAPLVPACELTAPLAWPDFPGEEPLEFDAHLHSCHDLVGARLRSRDGQRFGAVANFIIDTDDWLLIDVLVASHRWWPGGKEVAVSPLFVQDFDYEGGLLLVSQTKASVLEAPPFARESYGAAHRKRLVKHYSRRAALNQADEGQRRWPNLP